jgi:hypothetical protein
MPLSDMCWQLARAAFTHTQVPGEFYWLPHPEHAWVAGKRSKDTGSGLQFVTETGLVSLLHHFFPRPLSLTLPPPLLLSFRPLCSPLSSSPLICV